MRSASERGRGDERLRAMLEARFDVAVPRDLLPAIVAEAQRTRQRRAWLVLSPAPFAPPALRLTWHALLLALVLALAAGAALVGAELLRDARPTVPGAVWERVDAPAAFEDRDGGLRIEAVAVRGDLVVALGSGPEGGEVWISRSRDDWERVADADVFAAAEVRGVAASEVDFVAVGGRDGRCAAWRSSDGRSWTELDLASVCARGTLTDVAARGGTFVAAGDAGPEIDDEPAEGEPAVEAVRALVLVSHGGTDWRRTDAPPVADVGVTPVVTTGPDGWTILGREGRYMSEDGERWRRSGDRPDLDPRVATTWRGALVVGGSERTGPALATERDGGWTRAATPAAVGGSIVAFAAFDEWLVAAGDGPQGALVWTSTDGLTWTAAEVHLAAGARVRDLAVVGTRLIAVGDSGRGAAVWISSTEGHR